MAKRKKFIDPMEEYEKPLGISIIVHGEGEYPIVESVLHVMMDGINFKRNGGEIGVGQIRFDYLPKRKYK